MDMNIKIENLTKEQKEKIFEIFDSYLDCRFKLDEDENELEKITSLLGLGEVRGIKVEVYEYINKYDITSTNAEFTFYCENGKVKISKELLWKRADDELYISFYNNKDEEINVYGLDDLLFRLKNRPQQI